MYLPTHFSVDQPELVRAYVDAHPLALLVCTGADGQPCANHVPLRLQVAQAPRTEDNAGTRDASTDASTDADADTIADTNANASEIETDPAPVWLLEGHLARANPAIEQLRAAGRALVVFGGPGAYVSPALYEAAKAVPTWNYIAVHLSGVVSLVEDEAGKDALLKRLIAVHEPAYAARWRALPPEYQHSMLGAVVGLQVAVTRVEAKFKLSQNRPAGDRERVHTAHADGDAAQQEMAAWMRRLGTAG